MYHFLFNKLLKLMQWIMQWAQRKSKSGIASSMAEWEQRSLWLFLPSECGLLRSGKSNSQKAYYLLVLLHLLDVCCKRSELGSDYWQLHHENVPAHITWFGFLSKLRILPCDFWLSQTKVQRNEAPVTVSKNCLTEMLSIVEELPEQVDEIRKGLH